MKEKEETSAIRRRRRPSTDAPSVFLVLLGALSLLVYLRRSCLEAWNKALSLARAEEWSREVVLFRETTKVDATFSTSLAGRRRFLFSLFLTSTSSSPTPKKIIIKRHRPRERAQGRRRHPLSRVRLPDPLQEAHQARRAVRGEVDLEREREREKEEKKEKVLMIKRGGLEIRESRERGVFCRLVLSTTAATTDLPSGSKRFPPALCV